MKSQKIQVLFSILFFVLALTSFNGQITDDQISKKDVKLVVPKGFPDPVYTFKGNKLSPEIFVLGRQLFYDPILSKDNSVSCATCHQRYAAFAHIDHALSHGINGSIGKRNVPAIQNLIWQKNFMWDGGINHIEVQPIGPLTNPLEMDEKLEHIIRKLQKSEDYQKKFARAFGDTIVTTERIMKAFTQFMGLMISANSKYDFYRRNKDTLSATELRGLSLFRDNCTQCHTEPLFTNNTFQRNGLDINSKLLDSGRISITGIKEDYLKFKVPSLRNVQLTFPYMHDGRFKSLEAVMDFYSQTKIAGLKEGFTEQEKKDIIYFLGTLTDKMFLFDPRFMNPFEKRRVKIIQGK